MSLVLWVIVGHLILVGAVYLYIHTSPRFQIVKSPIFSLFGWLVYLHRRWIIWSMCGGYLALIAGIIIMVG